MKCKFTVFITVLLCLFSAQLFAQVIKGKVSDSNNAGLPGVSIQVKGTSRGTTTDGSGNYSISASKGATLVFSSVGHISKQVVVNDQSAINITMEDDNQSLDEVVVVGYGTQKKSELTNAVVQTSGKEITRSNNVSISNSLSGKLPGLFVNQTSSVPGQDNASITVRGPRTFRNSSALIVIDGVANADPDGLNRLDPNDIESISVLKDASAAIYGAQSAGGVVLVTTKRGKTGKPTFDFVSTYTLQSPTMRVQSANAMEYMSVINNKDAADGRPATFSDDFVNQFKSGQRKSEDWYGALVAPPATVARQSLTMRGGTETTRYFVSLGTVSQGGILRADDKTKLNQYNIRANMDVAVTKKLDVGVDISYRQKNVQYPQGGSDQIGSFANTSPLQPAYVDGDYRYPTEGWSQLNPAARLLSPGYQKLVTDVATGTLKFKYKLPVTGLALEGFMSLTKNYEYDKNFNYTWVYYRKDPSGSIIQVPSRSVEDIGLKEFYAQTLRTTQNIRLTYENTINKDHKLSGFVAYEQSNYDDNYFYAQRLGYDSPVIDQLFAGSPIPANQSNSGTATSNGRQNIFGRVAYEYKGKYLFGFSSRYDGSTTFPPGKRFGFFPQASAAWVISEEPFVKNSMFSNLKLRGSWGQLGNDRVDPYQYVGAYGYTNGWVVNGADVRSLGPKTTPNPNITWEVSETTNIGLELGFLNNNLTFEIDAFNTTTSNILAKRQASIPGYTGLTLPDENIGKMNSRGIDFQGAYNKTIGQVGMRIGANLTYSENKIVYFDEPPLAQPYQKLEGNPLNSPLVYQAIGIYRSAQDLKDKVSYPGAKVGDLIFADLNGDGKIDVNDQYRFQASPFPKMQFGVNLTLNYKNFDLYILLQGQSGAKWRLSNGFNADAGGNNLQYVALNSYSPANPNAELPNINYNMSGLEGANSDFYYHDVTWMRFKSAQLGYNLPKSLLSKAKISNLRVYVSADNLFMLFNSLSKYGAGDPETNSAPAGNPSNVLNINTAGNRSSASNLTSNLTGSTNGNAYPNLKNVTFGINLTF
ncbi:TonB-linked outer membrane protein, SusC/RagA family [Pseudarcicella hirudinis]|uniref:TonB-linked outer membrane protein, SusC/RagA family n=1 Tax=Pseudarcicella hirudinis TaxID=1079859 RepID=A0A1I5VII8_9BACT|nr:TonB-dependent receptor [Pseudarcicella hirudinis]SFQ07231.1 TonB-linked outer membrane protein, SusC/RagA family [Pseudarcicella hirudinis]